MRILFAQLRSEIRVIARNAEQLLVIIGIPAALLIFFSQVDVLPTNEQTPIDFLLPGIFALAIMSTAMVSLGIATGFERSYSVLKRLGATPLGTGRLILSKSLAVVLIEILQLVVLYAIAVMLGKEANIANVLLLIVAIFAGTLAFAGIGLLMAGTLRAEINLAAQNGLYLLLLLLGGVIFPLDELPEPLQNVGKLLPSGALADVLRGAITDTAAYGQSSWIVLACWALLAPLTATKFFRWNSSQT
jgi:ABC-2 type transport system permease protein